MDNEVLLIDRLGVIKDTITSYGEDNFMLSFSGGKDSTILHHLIDMALPGNKIPRVYINTGIEYNLVVAYVKGLAEKDSRIQIIQPQVNIKSVLDQYGYPFKSKRHSAILAHYQKGGKEGYKDVRVYLGEEEARWTKNFDCPKMLRYQFTDQFKLKVSDRCCYYMKEKPLDKWSKENKKPYQMTGIRHDEGGRREYAQCLAFQKGKLRFFQPLVKVDAQWEDWFIDKYNIRLAEIYYPPYNSERTGCKGCPFAINLQKTLDFMEEYLPNEKRQCEIIWKPVYEEYRRIGYRLRDCEQMALF